MLSTQQFANLCDTSKKTILYYDRIGLLKPNLVTENGRRYQVRQVLRFQKIMLLKSFGFSLDEISSMIDSEDFDTIFKERAHKLEDQQEKLTQKLKLVQRYLKNLKTKQLLINPKITTVGPYRYYAIRRVGRYVDINRYDRELSELIHDHSYKRVYVTIFHTSSYSPDSSDMTIGALIDESSPKDYQDTSIEYIPQHKVISYTHMGSYRYLSYVWQFLDQYVEDNGFCISKTMPTRELYTYGGLIEANEDKLVTELQIPIVE